MDKVLPSLDESEPVHGDLDTVLYLTDIHKVKLYQNLTYIVYFVLCLYCSDFTSFSIIIAMSFSTIFLAFAIFYNSPQRVLYDQQL